MPAKSKAQQRFMGMVHGIQKGTVDPSTVSAKVRKVAKGMKKKSAKDYASTKHKGKPEKVKKEERDYKDEYKKFQSSTKSKKYRAELNQYNRKKGTYGNNDGKDASHKGGKIMGFEKESTNRGRREKSRLKKESILKLRQMIREELLTEKKELGGALINKIERLTDVNNHTEARILLAKEVDKKLEQAYKGLNIVQDYLRRANETNIARNALDKKLFALAKTKFSDYDSIAGAF